MEKKTSKTKKSPKTKRTKKAEESNRAEKKTTVKKKTVKKEIKKPVVEPDKYFEAVGRRKRAVARVRLFTRGEKTFLVNGKPYQDYFSTLELQQVASSSLEKMKASERFKVSVKVKGGGIQAQAEAVRHAIARALLKFNPDFKRRLRRAGFLTRDSRERERKKFGLKRARRAPQWKKR